MKPFGRKATKNDRMTDSLIIVPSLSARRRAKNECMLDGIITVKHCLGDSWYREYRIQCKKYSVTRKRMDAPNLCHYLFNFIIFRLINNKQ